jgi:hypothetical protein|tara:strand:- start:205 stop:1041 length:837 start_codon:yes stop_codon:yes gene_type:complete
MPDDTAPAETVDNAEAVSETAPQTETSNDDWRSSLSEDIKDDPSFSKFKDVNSLAASYVNLQSHLGRDKIAKPVTDSDWDDVYEFLGRPDSPEKYEIELPDLPDEVASQFSDERVSLFKEEAHRLGLNADQVKSLINWQANNINSQHQDYKNTAENSIEQGEFSLRQEWGRAYDQNLSFAHKAFAEYGGDELAAKMESSGMGNDPDVLRAFANIAKTTMADKDLAGPSSGNQMALTPEEARAEAATIMSHPAYTDKRHPEHNSMVKKVQGFFNQAYAE